jgi:hypothetical protein
MNVNELKLIMATSYDINRVRDLKPQNRALLEEGGRILATAPDEFFQFLLQDPAFRQTVEDVAGELDIKIAGKPD